MLYTQLLQNSNTQNPTTLEHNLWQCLNHYQSQARDVNQTTELINALRYVQCTYKNNKIANMLMHFANTFSNAKKGMINYYSDNHVLQECHMRLCFELGILIQQFHTEPQPHLISRQAFFIKILNKQIPFLKRSGLGESWEYANYIKLVLDIYRTNSQKYIVEISHQEHALASYFLTLKGKERDPQKKHDYLIMAKQHIDNAISAYPEYSAHHTLYASIQEATGTYLTNIHPVLSMACFEQALGVFPAHKIEVSTELFCHFGILSVARNLKTASAPFEQRVQTSVQRLKELRDSNQLTPEHQARVYNELGVYEFYAGQLDNAVFYLQKAIKIKTAHHLLHPKDMSRHQLAATYSVQATKLKELGKHKEAIELLTKAYKQSKYNSEPRKQGSILTKIAGSFFSMNQTKDAAEAAITAMKTLHTSLIQDYPGTHFTFNDKSFEENKSAITHLYKSRDNTAAFKQAANVCENIQRLGSELRKSMTRSF